MDENKKEEDKNIESFSKKDWLNYIDKLINRENAKNNKLGITAWVLIVPLVYLLSKVVDLLFYSGVYAKSYFTSELTNLYCLFSLFTFIIYIFVSMLKQPHDSENGRFASLADIKSLKLYYTFVLIVFLFFNFSIDGISTGIKIILYILIVLYMCGNTYLDIHKAQLDRITLYVIKTYILILKFKNILALVILILSSYLSFIIIQQISEVKENYLYFAIYSYLSVLIILAIIYILLGDFRLRNLRKLENKIILDETMTTASIRKTYETDIIGNGMEYWTNRYSEDLINQYNNEIGEKFTAEKEFNEKLKEWKNIKKEELSNIIETETVLLKHLEEMYLLFLNIKIYGICIKSNKIIKETNSGINMARLTIKWKRKFIINLKKLKDAA